MTLENDLLKMLHQETVNGNRLIAAYLSQQLTQARRTPGTAKLTTFNLLNPVLPAPTALQILTKNDKRHSVAVSNYGPADILLSEKHFDPTTVLQWFSDPANPDAILPGFNQAIPIGFVTSGGSVTLDATTGLWAYSLGSTGSSNKNAIVTLADSLFVTTEDWPKSEVGAYHMSELHPLEEPGGGQLTA